MSSFAQTPVVNKMDAAGNTINALMGWIDNTVAFFSRGIYESLVADNTGLIITLFAVSISLYGWLILHGKLEFTVRESANHILLLGAVAVLLVNYDVFTHLIYGWFTTVPDALAGSIIKALGDKDLNTDSSVNALALFVDRTFRLIKLFWEGDWDLKLGAVAIGIMSVILFGSFLTILLVAKLAVGVLLAEAPIFLLFGIFKSTKGMLEGWLRQLWAMFIVQVQGLGIMAVIIMILRHPVTQLENGSVVVSLESVLSLALILVPMLWLAKQMFGLSQSIAGGFVMQQYSVAQDGIMAQGRGAWNRAKNGWRSGKDGLNWVRNRF